ncbi:MAG: NAD(P)H-dependent oxidoreductase [Acidobacteria bacterium]|nr:NAD(P)H-dependent oxidoreductase [Acidobacteriota bacterium]
MHGMKVLGIAGSLRRDSFNRKALHIAKQLAAATAAEVEEADLKELALPVYDGDIEAEGMPQQVVRFKAMVEGADVLLIASPEYNHSIPGGLKNAIDWLSRGRNSLDGKVAAIFGASSGPYGTARGQIQLRYVLGVLNVLVIPQPMVYIRNGAEAFNPDGSFQNPQTTEMLKRLVDRALAVSAQLRSGDSVG